MGLDLLGSELFLSVLIGVVGALSRLALQYYRDGDLEQGYGRSLALLFLGGVGGWLALLISGYVPIGIWALGFTASDVIENLADTHDTSDTHTT